MTQKPRIWVTRPEPDASDTAARLAALDLVPIIAPLLEMQVLQTSLPDPQGFGAIALTSGNALRALEARDALTPYLHLPAFCVGDRTASRAAEAGFTTITSADGAFDDLVNLLRKAAPAGPIFYPTAQHTSGDLASVLAPTDRLVITTPIYDMRPPNQLPTEISAALTAGTIDAISFYSRRTAETFCTLAANMLTSKQCQAITVLCLSENVAAPLLENHFTRIGLADYPSEEAMMALALCFARGQII